MQESQFLERIWEKYKEENTYSEGIAFADTLDIVSWIGRELEVVVEGLNEETGIYYGRSYMDAPDIDTRVYFDSPYEQNMYLI